MIEKDIYELKVNPQFKDLIVPIPDAAFQYLKNSIISQGCREPIIIWNGYIVDGHNRYEICSTLRIPFETKKADFESKDVAIAWICLNQLKRTDLTEEMRHYLIGKQYESERAAYWYSVDNTPIQPGEGNKVIMTRTAVRQMFSGRIAEENNISKGTVEKYARYARALDAIADKHPEFVKKVLQGQYKISHDNIAELSKLTPAELRKVQARIERMQEKDSVKFYQIRSILNNNIVKQQSKDLLSGTSVKDMPEFDPDAEIVGLTLTIPTWIRSVDRVMKKTNLTIATKDAKNNLSRNAGELIEHLKRLISAIKE